MTALSSAAFFGATSANAVVYDVTDAQTARCGGHGLWTNREFGRRAQKCNNFFSIEGTLEVENSSADTDDWFAALEAVAVNPQGLEATINLIFGGWENEWKYKKEGGESNPDLSQTAPEGIDFFTTVRGTIEIDNVFYNIDSFVDGYAFQYGPGANAKDADAFGASAWIDTKGHWFWGCNEFSYRGYSKGCIDKHWDLNLTLKNDVNEVPIPGTLVLFGTALFGFGAIRRRMTAKA